MNIYKYLDYKKFLSDLLKKKKISRRFLALKTNINVAYFSRCLKSCEKACFSKEQLFHIIKFLDLSEEDSSYLHLLLDLSRTSDYQYQQFLKKKIDKIRDEKSSIKNQMKSEPTKILSEEEMTRKYFSSWYYTEIYLLLTISKYRLDPQLIKKRLNIDQQLLDKILDDLHHMGLIRFSEKKIECINKKIHLDEKNPLAFQHHLNWRLKNIEHLTNQKSEDYHFTVVISGSYKLKKEIIQKFKDLLHEIYNLTKDSSNEEIVHLNLDVF